MSDESRFVPMSDLLGSNANSWADDPQEQATQPEAKPKNAWGKVEEVKAIDIAQVAEEDRKKKKEEASGENVGWTNVGNKQQESGSRPSHGYQKSEGSYERRSEQKGESRPRNPLPDNPPFTAFVGNLSYEVDNSDLTDFFEGLSVKEARVVKDNGKSKGFGYVEFGDRSSLEKALTANQTMFKGRNLNIDVASQKPSTTAQWGPSSGGSKFGGRGEKSDRGGFNDNNRGGFGNKGFGGRGFSRGPPPGERPKLDLKPRTQPLDNPPPSNPQASTPEKKPGENPFGFDTDRSKLDKAAEERLKLEQQREQKRKDELAKLEQGREERKNQPQAKKEWRSGPPNPNSYGGRGGGQNSSSGRGQKKESNNNSNNSGTLPKRGWEKPVEQKKEEQNQKKNIYDVLGDEGADEGDEQ